MTETKLVPDPWDYIGSVDSARVRLDEKRGVKYCSSPKNITGSRLELNDPTSNFIQISLKVSQLAYCSA